ncbi:MAG: hypothetical protein JJU20_01595 [Opitutales bacterium]|nr:hypothetical protein [Opitutales bacterium]
MADDELSGLRQQVEQLSLAVDSLQSQNQPAFRVAASGFRVDSPDGVFKFQVNGLIQLDHRAYLNSESGDRGGHDTFELRRVRPTLQGQLGKSLGFRFTPELSGTVRVLDAYGDFYFADNSFIRFGNAKGPVGLERLQGGANLLFNERGLATEFTPARELGIQLQSRFADQTATLRLGVFNGALDGSNGAPSTSSNGDFSVAGSFYLQPFRSDPKSPLNGFGFGLAASYGKNEGNAAFRLRAPHRLDVARNTSVLEDGSAYRLNPGAYFYSGPFGLLAEYIQSNRELYLAGGSPTRYSNNGWTIAFSYFLTGENNGYGRVNPSNPFQGLGAGGIGAWELAFRLTGIDLDQSLFADGLLNESQATAARSYGLGLNWYITSNLKLLLSYEQTAYSDGSGHPGIDRSIDRSVLSRLQVVF